MAKYLILKDLTLKPIAPANARVSADYFIPVTIPANTIVEGTVKSAAISIPVSPTSTANGALETLSFTYNDKNFITMQGTYKLNTPATPHDTGVITKYYNAIVNSAKYGYKVGDAIKVGIKYNPMIQSAVYGGATYYTYDGKNINDKELWKINPITHPAVNEIILGTEIPAADIVPPPSPTISAKSFFTPKNALIGIAIVLAIYGLTQMFKEKKSV